MSFFNIGNCFFVWNYSLQKVDRWWRMQVFLVWMRRVRWMRKRLEKSISAVLRRETRSVWVFRNKRRWWTRNRPDGILMRFSKWMSSLQDPRQEFHSCYYFCSLFLLYFSICLCALRISFLRQKLRYLNLAHCLAYVSFCFHRFKFEKYSACRRNFSVCVCNDDLFITKI